MGIKQVIVLRTDLNMRKGKMIAQGAHASLASFFDRMEPGKDGQMILRPDAVTKSWMEGLYRKVVLGVESEEGLLRLKEEAERAGLHAVLIVDAGLTEFHGVPTPTALAIGPDEDGRIDPVTGSLRLL
jgi:PTH2 family peptidyl-tRNA hydrolase